MEDEVWMKDAAMNRGAWVRGEGASDSQRSLSKDQGGMEWAAYLRHGGKRASRARGEVGLHHGRPSWDWHDLEKS